MPLEYRYVEDGGVIVRGTGEVKGEELFRTNARIYELPATLETLAYQLWDLTDAESVALNREFAEALAAQDREAARRFPHMVIAIAVKTDVGFGFSRLWEANVGDEGIETHVFRTVEEARAWLEQTVPHRRGEGDPE
ncbi:MAG: hypothetical protein P1V51_23565 [Deltaproteobacteria bacterium]|nr:hypothetical protein [Deltaproteobacteria bacterium]